MKKIKNFKIIGNFILVKPDPPPDRYGDLVIPDSAKEYFVPLRGTVVAVCEYVRERLPDGTIITRPPKVNVGDRICYGEYSGLAITLNLGDKEEVFRYMREDEIIAIIEEEE